MADIDATGQFGLAEYFRQQIDQINQPQTGSETRWYIGDMLERFARSEQLFSYDEDHFGVRPLALLYEDALTSDSERERCQILRQLGDQALFLGALFPELYQRKGISRDYFIGMGGGAYDYLAHNALVMRDIFTELATRFAQILELIARVCNRYRRLEAREIVALYQRWKTTGDSSLASQLREMGIILINPQN